MSFLRVIDQNTARHPVARAAAKAHLRSTLRTFQIQLYGLPDGTEQGQALMQALQVLQVAAVVAETRGDDTPGRLPVIRGALSACFERIEHGFLWRGSVAVAIDRGLTEALSALDAATAKEVRSAWAMVEKAQRRALQPDPAPGEQEQPLEHLSHGAASPGKVLCVHPVTMRPADAAER